VPDPGSRVLTTSVRHLMAVLLLAGLAACAPGADRNGFPTLLPIDELLAQAGTPTEDPGPALTRRAAALKARVAASAP
jgi:hypothetical protein